MAPTLYYSEFSAPSRSILMIVKELGLKLNLQSVYLDNAEQLKSEFLKNPQDTVPRLEEEDGFTIWDSHAIGPYLVRKYGKNDSLYPKDLKKKAVVDQRLQYDSGILTARLSSVASKLLQNKAKEVPEEDIESLKEAYGFLETFLRNGGYVTGNHLTIADFNIVTNIITAFLFVPVDEDEFPRISLWLKRIKSLPYFNEVNDRGIKLFETFVKPRLDQ